MNSEYSRSSSVVVMGGHIAIQEVYDGICIAVFIYVLHSNSTDDAE